MQYMPVYYVINAQDIKHTRISKRAGPCEVYGAVHMPRRVLFTAQAPPRTPAGYIAGHRAGNILRPIHKPHST